MENKFEYLRIDGRDRLPSPWFSYPVLTEYETVAIYRNGRDYLDVLVGRQDGWMLCHKKLRGAARQAVLDKIDDIRQLKLF